MSVSMVLKKVCAVTGEAPHWDHERHLLYYVDISAGNIFMYNPATGENVKENIGGFVGFAIPRTQGGLVIGHDRNLSTYDMESGKETVIEEVEEGQDTRFNDGKCDPSGRLWAGTMGLSPMDIPEHRKQGALYSVDADHSLSTRVEEVDLSNGMAWSPDGKTMYYIDSLKFSVDAFDFDINTGDISNRRVVYNFGSSPEARAAMGTPDGMCIDTDGNLWVACYGAGKVVQINPCTGEVLREVEIPGAKQTTSCCFGGDDLDILYVTTARHPKRIPDAQQPLAGSLFKVTGLGVKGFPCVSFAG